MRRVFIAGLPGTGKTTFGDWLQEKKGYFHLDMESRLRNIQPLYSQWKKAAEGGGFEHFALEMNALGEKVVMTWGFPPHAIGLAEGIRNLGVSCWWFDAPRGLARKNWLAREGHSDDTYFQAQCADIEAAQNKIEELFHPNIFKVINDDGRFLAPETIARRMNIM